MHALLLQYIRRVPCYGTSSDPSLWAIFYVRLEVSNMSHWTIKANLDNKLRCLFLCREGRDHRAAHGLFMAERLHLLPPFILKKTKPKKNNKKQKNPVVLSRVLCIAVPSSNMLIYAQVRGDWILNLDFGCITVQRWSIMQSIWLKASSVMGKLYFWLNIEYLLLFHHHSRSWDQATGQRQCGCLVPLCIQHLHTA